MSYTLATYRQTVAPLVGSHERGTATNGANNTTAQLECTTASHTGLRFRSSVSSDALFQDKWLFRPSAAASGDKDRLISIYTASTGCFTPDDVWTNAPTSEAFEIHGLFSGTETAALINEGLKRCLVVQEVTFTVASNQLTRHSLASVASWITEPRQVFQVGVLPTGQDPLIYRKAQTTGRVIKLGDTVYLDGVSFNTTDTIYLTGVARAYDLCAAAGTPTTFTQSGLSAEADVALADPEWVAWATILAGADRLDTLIEAGTAGQEAMEARREAAARFSTLTQKRYQEPARTFTPRTWLGPTRSASWSR